MGFRFDEAMLKNKTPIKLKKMLKVFLCLTGVGVLAGSIHSAVKMENKEKLVEKLDDDYTNRMFLNDNGVPYTLDDAITKNEIKVCIDSTFSEEEKEDIKKAIEQFDLLAENLEYDVYYSDNPNIYKSIVITSDYNFNNKSKTLAETNLHFQDFSAEIVYPISIYLNKDKIPEQAVNKVVQHEILHTLGFADLYDEKYIDNLMYYNTASTVTQISDTELEMLNILYNSKSTNKIVAEYAKDATKYNYLYVKNPNFYTNSKNNDDEFSI